MIISFRSLLWVFLTSIVLLAGCSSSEAGPTEADVQAYITQREKNLATGVGSSHSAVTVDFERIRFGDPREANEKDRVINGITGPMVYPVRVKYISHRSWGGGDKEDKPLHYEYDFYRDSFGEWDAYLSGPVND